MPLENQAVNRPRNRGKSSLTVSQVHYIIGFAAARTSIEPGKEFMTQPQAKAPDRIVHVALSA